MSIPFFFIPSYGYSTKLAEPVQNVIICSKNLEVIDKTVAFRLARRDESANRYQIVNEILHEHLPFLLAQEKKGPNSQSYNPRDII